MNNLTTRQFSNFFLDLIFPPVCLSCGKLSKFICYNCQKKLQLLNTTICPSCLKKTNHGQIHKNCSGNIQGLISVFRYKQTMQKIIKNIKYRYYFAGFNNLLPLFFKHLKNQKNPVFYHFLTTKPILVPIPLHSSRKKLRGFNQSLIITKYLSQKLKLPFSCKIIQRIKNTQYQSELTKIQRQKNIQNAFAPSKFIKNTQKIFLTNKNILLIDDVWTTGKTCHEAAKVLKKLGVKNIWILTLAR